MFGNSLKVICASGFCLVYYGGPFSARLKKRALITDRITMLPRSSLAFLTGMEDKWECWATGYHCSRIRLKQ